MSIAHQIVYLSPLRALVQERYTDWTGKFERFGLRILQLTGDSTDKLPMDDIDAADVM